MILDNIDEFFGQIQQADKNQRIDNFEQTYINSPRNPYTQEIINAINLQISLVIYDFFKTCISSHNVYYVKYNLLKCI